jgi:putative transposase
VVTPSAERQAIALLVGKHRVSVVHACRAVRLARAAWYRPLPDRLARDAPVVEALTAVVAENGRWGFWKCYDRLRLLGRPWNHKRVHRVYCALRLNRARRTKRRVPRRPRVPLVAPPTLNQTWALDFMRDTLYDGRVFRTLNVLDQGNREALAIEIGGSLPSRRVLALLEEPIALRGAPTALRMDNGPEFLALRLAEWAEARGITLDFIQPGQPAQNAFIERFNQTYRTDVLDANVFTSLAEVRAVTADWLRRYNTERPQESLGSVPPLTFLPRATSTQEYHLQVST